MGRTEAQGQHKTNGPAPESERYRWHDPDARPANNEISRPEQDGKRQQDVWRAPDAGQPGMYRSGATGHMRMHRPVRGGRWHDDGSQEFDDGDRGYSVI